MTTVVFSEEYTRVTKGMFAVWMAYVHESSKHHDVTILLNREHWAFAEAVATFDGNSRVTVERLPFIMPGTACKRLLSALDHVWLLRAARFALGQTLNLLCAPAIILYLAVRLRQLKPNAVFSHNGGWPAGQLCRWIVGAAALARVPTRVLVVHNYPAGKPNSPVALLQWRWHTFQARLIDVLATDVVAVSDSLRMTLERQVFRRPVVRIYNGIGLSTSSGTAPGDVVPLDWSPAGLVVGFVGALYPLKGPHVLLDAFRYVQVPCELALLGPSDPMYLASLERRAKLCANKVTFLGFHRDVDSFMERIDLLVVPSVAYESFGMVILEAMSHGKPVVCSDFGGMKEIVEDGVTGVVVPARDDAALAAAITTLLTNAGLRREMGHAGKRRLIQHFTSVTMAHQYDNLVAGE